MCVSESLRSSDGSQCYCAADAEAGEATMNRARLPRLPAMLHATRYNKNLNIQPSATLTSNFFFRQNAALQMGSELRHYRVQIRKLAQMISFASTPNSQHVNVFT